ncbi:hypothetical protein SAMN05421747_102290 [Parapedobacter composti]|uniref:Uncharacterized protein n=1 Tax=Parapedobacter composti TaxID=623281 RepID=A0A1I1F6X3_9SPHI|nr:hypothetical protein [Parapedobacter composti]SFB95239.1 hypothetical protein SAMN05421747_102290 [Parapedobacter composti]
MAAFDDLHTVTFKVAGFETEITPLAKTQAARLAHGMTDSGVLALTGVTPSTEPQYLYYWSFNNETLTPDIAVDETGAGIVFEAKTTEPGFGTGFGLSPVEAGKSLSLEGLKTLEITLPMQGVVSLTAFALDVSSSNTGPKSFVLSYSIDEGETYTDFNADNQFQNMNPQARNRYDFDMGEFSQFIGIRELRLKLTFLPGNREGAGDYNENTGVVRLDNIRLSGVYSGEGSSGDPDMPSALRYYIFSADDGRVVAQQEVAMGAVLENGKLDVKLNPGVYDIVFVAYRTRKDVLLPAAISSANEFYFGHHFDDHQAVTYASSIRNMEVGNADMEETITLKRCYSQITFDFTDFADDLLAVKKIVITREHPNYLYTPFGMPDAQPLSDVQSVSFSGFTDLSDYQVSFHQFLGLLNHPAEVIYELTAYGEDGGVLNTLILAEPIINNVRLLLRGRLLGNTGSVNGFAVVVDTEWDQSLEREF